MSYNSTEFVGQSPLAHQTVLLDKP